MFKEQKQMKLLLLLFLQRKNLFLKVSERVQFVCLEALELITNSCFKCFFPSHQRITILYESSNRIHLDRYQTFDFYYMGKVDFIST